MTFNRLDTIKQVLQDKYFRWFDALELEDLFEYSDNIGYGYGNGNGLGYGYGNIVTGKQIGRAHV